MLTGATWTVAGMRVNYGCPGDVAVVGDLDRSAPTWKAFVLRAGAGDEPGRGRTPLDRLAPPTTDHSSTVA